MSKRDDNAYLQHILDSIAEIEGFISAVDESTFVNSPLYLNACIRCLEVIGEASKSISEPTKSKAPDVPWKDIAGMRDILIHNYFGVDKQAVWSTCNMDIPVLKQQITELIVKR